MQSINVYETLFWIGALGVVTMSVMGFAAHGAHGGGHSHGGHSHGAHGHSGHSNGAHSYSTQGHGTTAKGHDNGNSHESASRGDRSGDVSAPLMAILGYLSPLTLFSVSLGAGATGLLLGSHFSVAITALIAIAAGIILFNLVIRPFMGVVRSFASQPATALAGTIANEATAQSRFDADGRGIVTVNIDGQLVRLLAFLERDDLQKGTVIGSGERLVVTQIDEAKNTCHVTKL